MRSFLGLVGSVDNLLEFIQKRRPALGFLSFFRSFFRYGSSNLTEPVGVEGSVHKT